ncbi:glycine zipper 2TM domain-containing protein [Paucibacter sp. APW11]|uniref:Glycine zipper 2TM domain-containing protein n=1 Tax=Roseateles aquae TaxID=3077235 RepID=A0ABU3P558_9BURK|nr:glycine zipper 2TM domain-containing protein [Paucibacter sp. APW11]MDT8997711.1 glycine zipper 2TM domain-containing protein [Paucibacter sp. APW11]
MNTSNDSSRGAIAGLLLSLALLSACSNMSRRDRDVAVGAGVGALGGAVLTGGSTVGTVGGAAVGAVIANEADKDKRKRREKDE